MGRSIVGRVAETVGLGLIGDGVIGLIQPERHAERWESGPAWWQRALRPVVGDAKDSRVFAAAEVVAGIALVWWLLAGKRRR